ncbi:hypothetical protein J5X84_26715 [Streptosporangiaceae bacterium NEAU-GS5]|nr:hypothetical protein [Streptosporangiaceae bacterium NEAU-GS5]
MQVWDFDIVWRAASALRFLARHARDRTGASGVASTVVSLSADSAWHEAIRMLRPNVPHALHDARVAILTAGSLGTASRLHGAEPQSYAMGRSDFLPDDLADGGWELAMATERLVSSLFLAYNAVGVEQISREGVLQLAAWSSAQESARRWATGTGTPTYTSDSARL